MSSAKRGAGAAILVCSCALLFYGWLHRGYVEPGPPRTADGIGDLSRASTITIPIGMSLDDIEREANERLPRLLYSIDEDRNACVPATRAKICIPRIFRRGCAARIVTNLTPQVDCHLNGAVERGTVSISGSGTTANVTAPVSASVKAHERGLIGKLLPITANGSIVARAAVQADLDADWQAVANVDADYSWVDRIGVDVHGLRITFANKVDPKIRELIANFKAGLPQFLAKLEVRQHAAEAWSQSSGTILVARSPDVWLRFSPTAAGFGGYAIDGRNLRATVMAGGTIETFIGSRPADRPATLLPPLQRKLPEPSFDFYVPVQVEYGALAEAARKALKVGTEQTFEVPHVGSVKVVFRDVQVFQTTGRRLAIGVGMEARPPSSLFDTRGILWTVADASIDNEAKRARVGHLEVYSKTDDPALDLLTTLIRLPQVNRPLRDALDYDFSRDYARAMDASVAFLNRPLSDRAYLSGTVGSLRADRVVAGPVGLVAAFDAKGSAEIRFGQPSHEHLSAPKP